MVISSASDQCCCSSNMSGNFTDMEDFDFDNLTIDLSCTARSIQRSVMLPYSSTLITTIRSFQTLFYILILVSGIFLNTLVVVLVAKYKKLQTRSFAIALQVVVPDLILSCTVFVLRPITAIANKWLFGEVMCIFTGYIYLTYFLLRALLMLVFVIDRFLTVFFLFSYPKYSFKIVLILSVLTWIFSLGFRIMGFPGILDCYSYVPTIFLCVHSIKCSTSCAIVGNVSVAIVYGPATIIPIVLYSALYCKARRINKRQATMLASSGGDDNSEIRKREWRANFTFFFLFLSVFALTTPVVTLSLTFAAVRRSIGPSPVIYTFQSLWSTMTAFLVIADPIVVMRNGDVRDILRQIKGKFMMKLRSTGKKA